MVIANNITETSEYMPSQKLRTFVQALLSREVMGNQTKAQELTGVTRQMFSWYLKHNPEFEAWYKKQCAQIFTPFVPATAWAIQKAALKGDMKAAFKIMEHAGIFTPEAQPLGGQVNIYPTHTYIIKDLKEDGDEGNSDKCAEESATGSRFGISV